MISNEYMENVLQSVLEALVSDPEELRIERRDSYKHVQFRIHVPKRERAKIIGCEGRVIRGLKSVIGALGGKIKTDVELKIVE